MKVDCHAHCLPAIDDGAKDVEMSLQMLAQTRSQGIETVIATPHFYMGIETVEEFLQRRQKSYEMLSAQLTQAHPRVVLGAEVLMRRGLSRTDLRALCIEGTNCLLLELPFMSPPPWLFEEVENLILDQSLRVILAHVDRYMPWYSIEQAAQLGDLPDVIMQINGEFLLERRHFRKLRHWLPKEPPLLLGSDMHNMESRPPLLEEARRRLKRYPRGNYWLQEMDETADLLLKGQL